MFIKRIHVRLKGTLLKLFIHHVGHEDLKQTQYIRDLIKKDLAERYNVNGTGGIVKIPRKL